MQKDSLCIVVGAGASGLMAARVLSSKGVKVLILEGRNRSGGRIHTLEEAAFGYPAETGAEFIHGNLPVTLKILQEAGIAYHPAGGKTWNARNGKLKSGEMMMEGWPMLMKKLKELESDLSIEEFLQRYFSDEKYQSLRKSLTGFVEGYDAADPARASAFALRDEWMSDDDHEQYRVEGGYQHMIQFLESECTRAGVNTMFNARVEKISWTKGSVEVSCGLQKFQASRILVTVPLGVWKAGSLQFSPALPEKISAAHEMGFGAVIKILLGFNNKFWEDIHDEEGKKLKGLGFLFSGEQVPTWWTQHPEDSPLLTGWLAGPKASRLANYSEQELLSLALDSLSNILNVKKEWLKEQLRAHRIVNWCADSFAIGAYGYATVKTPEARKQLSAPVSDTLYFGGEALYDGPEMGTVEAALASGERAAHEILKTL
ncbi:MAG: flavin monoamine oxidase family protein [Cytophagaceae bacterium]